MFDKKDKKLIYELDLNARTPINLLAKRIGLSQEATRYRLEKLVNKKIIRGFVTYLNFTRLGYYGYAIYCRHSNINEAKKAEVKNYLKNHENIYWIAEYGGRFDLCFSIFAKTPDEFDQVFNLILNKCSSALTDITFITKLEPHKYAKDYLLDKQRIIPTEKITNATYELTEIEKQVIKQLSTNARVSSAEIARNINKPLSTVIYTIKKLENNKIIGGYTIILDTTAFDYQSFQLNLITKNMTPQKFNKVFTYCESNPHIIMAIKVIGSWNIELIYEVKNAKMMREQIIELRSQFHDEIKDIELLNLFEDYIKLNHYPFRTG